MANSKIPNAIRRMRFLRLPRDTAHTSAVPGTFSETRRTRFRNADDRFGVGFRGGERPLLLPRVRLVEADRVRGVAEERDAHLARIAIVADEARAVAAEQSKHVPR